MLEVVRMRVWLSLIRVVPLERGEEVEGVGEQTPKQPVSMVVEATESSMSEEVETAAIVWIRADCVLLICAAEDWVVGSVGAVLDVCRVDVVSEDSVAEVEAIVRLKSVLVSVERSATSMIEVELP